MKIGFDAKRIFHNSRGLGNFGRTLLKGLLQYGPGPTSHHYTLYTPAYSPFSQVEFLEKSALCSIVTPSIKNKLYSAFWRSLRLGQLIERDQLDIYHGLSQELPWYLGSSKTAKYLLTIHDLMFINWPEYYSPIDRWIYFHKMKKALQIADLVHCISEQTKTHVLDNFKIDEEKIRVIPQSIDPHFFSTKADLSSDRVLKVKRHYQLPASYILYIGALEAKKNIREALMAYKEIQHKIEEGLIIVGRDQGEKQKILDFIQKHQLETRIKVIENGAFEDLPILYDLASAFIFLSKDEGMGLPVVEARARGIPCILSDIPIFREFGGKGSHIHFVDISQSSRSGVDDPNPALVKAILECTQFKSALKLRAREEIPLLAEEFSLKKYSGRMIDLYQEMLT